MKPFASLSSLVALLGALSPLPCGGASPLPNILWITSEDNGPHLGCYGDTYADTPNLDALAAKSIRFTNAISNAPVCAPARTAIISGLYPPSTGSEHMRSMTHLPDGFKLYPQFLREAGYYCTNNSKEDYNLKKPADLWHDSGNKAHWKNRPAGQPFFAVFNSTTTHESSIRSRNHTFVHDPAKAPLPKYHPDNQESRQGWAQYYDKMTAMDREAGARLQELQDAGLAENTIVFYYGDHGPGLPRNKRWPYNSGLSVPLIIHVPEAFKSLAPPGYAPGSSSDRLVSFVDFAPTLCSIAGIRPPDYLQGHAFMGKFPAPEQPFSYGFRGRMDERYDLVRTVRDKRYIYLRHYMPHRIYGQWVSYMFETPTTQAWKDLYDAGKLDPIQKRFWEEKPSEELYDLENDPDEVTNLADSPDHAEILDRMRDAQESWSRKIADVGFLPEHEIHARSGTDAPYTMGHDPARYDFENIYTAACLASNPLPGTTPSVLELFASPDSAVRYWAATGLLIRKEEGVKAGLAQLRTALGDESLPVRIAAAEALGRFGEPDDLKPALDVLLASANAETHGIYVAMAAFNAIDYLDAKAAPLADALKKLPQKDPKADGRTGGYIERLLSKTLADLR